MNTAILIEQAKAQGGSCPEPPARRRLLQRSFSALALLLFISGAFNAVSTSAATPDPSSSEVSFSREILPVLSDNCFTCHGPDENKRKADLRLDLQASALAPAKSGERAVVPGQPSESELIHRIFTDDPDEVMPPAKTGKKLTTEQKELFKRWINDGATWQNHWAYEPLMRPSLPSVNNHAWVRNEIDRFVLARLEQEGISPSPEADRVTLIRRATLDLTGLPPTPEEVDAFVANDGTDAYETLIDRLLASPHYGERMALPWLDAARYADSNGFQSEGDNFQYVWRDWVVRALNANLPFDQFTIQQLAGDLLPEPTIDEKVASGFNRCHMLNGEGGAIPEEQRNVVVFDRVDVTATTWLGVTMACAQCHDHKYDPFTTREYYQFFAFFNNVPERGTPDSNRGAHRLGRPTIYYGTDAQLAELAQLEKASAATSAEVKRIEQSPDTQMAQVEWEKLSVIGSAVTWHPLEPTSFEAVSEAVITKLEDDSLFVTGPNPDKDSFTITLTTPLTAITGIRLETIPDERLPAKGAGRSDSGNAFLTDFKVALQETRVSLKAATADYAQGGFVAAHTIDTDTNSGWAFHPEVAKPHQLVVEPAEPLHPPTATLTVTLDFQSVNKQHVLGRFRFSATTNTHPAASLGIPSNILALVVVEPTGRTADEATQVRNYFLANHAPAPLKAARDDAGTVQNKLRTLQNSMPIVMIMSDDGPRQTHILERGNYEMPGDKVKPGTPASLPPMPEDAPRNRLGLAQWLVSSENPLTARVQVNRHWQMFFGRALVKTSENLGMQSDPPTHPKLLDWLAAEFRDKGWDMKRLHKKIVTSATYRQSSKLTPTLRERDPANRLLARGARFRLPSLLLRDVALAASGLLEAPIGGKPVYPYQPKGIWSGLAITKARNFNYPQSKGANLYRRSLYTFWRRTVAPGNMFDSSVRQTCSVKPSITSTPLHALTTLNDVTWVEASRFLAERVMKEPGRDPDAKLAKAFRLVCARKPSPEDLGILRRSFDRALTAFQASPAQAGEFLDAGDAPRDPTLNETEHAAYASACLAIFNLDEALTRE